jgi:drug/metabolite transporter (DMT)-like permease
MRGILLAAASGAIASGVGYSIWYSALRGLTATRAAVIQLSVPVIASAGGVLLFGESISARLVVSTVAIIGGVAFVVTRR